MAQPKGKTGNPNGRPRGTPNKSTTQAREAIAAFVDKNSERLDALLDEIHQTEGPLATFNCIRDLIEYHVPKIARTEHSGPNGGPINTQVTKIIIAAADDDS